MTARIRSILLLVLVGALLTPTAVSAQNGPLPTAPRLSALDMRVEIPSSRIVRAQPASGNKAVLIGVLVGAGAALGLTAAAAARYGENEGGGFCPPCMVQWSAFTLPVGAALGAGVGYGIKRARRSVTTAPLFSHRAAGIAIVASF